MYCGPQNFGSRTAYGLYRYDEARRISVLLDASRILMSPFFVTPATEIYFCKFIGIFRSPVRNRLQVFPWLLSQWTLCQCSPADSDCDSNLIDVLSCFNIIYSSIIIQLQGDRSAVSFSKAQTLRLNRLLFAFHPSSIITSRFVVLVK